MSGGGNQVMKGAMSSKKKSKREDLLSEEDLQKILKQIEEDEKNIRSIKESKQEINREIENSRSRMDDLQRNILLKINMDLESFISLEKEISNKKIPALKKTVENQSNQGDIEIAKNLKKKLDSLQLELDTLKNDAQLIQSSVEELKNKISNIGGKKMQNQKETVESISRQIYELSSKITTAKGILFSILFIIIFYFIYILILFILFLFYLTSKE